MLAVANDGDETVITHMLSLTPLKRIMKDYFMICESYYEAIRSAPPSRIQAIDMGRRGLHDEGSRTLLERLAGKITVDLDTARLQARLGGGLAGHNGLRSIAQRLGSQDFLRLRIGVGRPGRGDPRPVADYVLSAFSADDDAEGIVSRAADAVECLVAEGLEETQRRFN